MSLSSFTPIPDSKAILRLSGGVFKEVAVYHRNEKLYVPYGAGFALIGSSLGDHYCTSVIKLAVVELEAEGIVQESLRPVYRPKLRKQLKAVPKAVND